MHNVVLLLKQKWCYFLLATFLLGIDQFTKSMAVASLVYGQPVPFLPFFNFTLLHNYGAAFSFLSDAGGWQQWFFSVVASAVSLLLLFWIMRLSADKKLELTGFSCILAGALGNLWDRLQLGYVIDFVDWFYVSAGGCLPFFYGRAENQTCHWPAFNVADAVILLGVGLLILDTFINTKHR